MSYYYSAVQQFRELLAAHCTSFNRKFYVLEALLIEEMAIHFIYAVNFMSKELLNEKWESNFTSCVSLRDTLNDHKIVATTDYGMDGYLQSGRWLLTGLYQGYQRKLIVM
jgi:hypothetical protein